VKEVERMGYRTKVQRIRRTASEQWYVPLPAQLARAMDFRASEDVEWLVDDRQTLVLSRTHPPDVPLKKKRDSRGV
jgi:antitoxin component of MazEF toxin-antitoxin module